MALTVGQLQTICPKARHDDLVRILKPLNATMQEFGISTHALRAAAFVAQVAHESGGFRYLKEIWGPTDAQKRYEPPSALATRLGNTQAGDGYRFRGRGLIQITGRGNYADMGGKMGFDFLSNPDLLAEPLNAARSAGFFWDSRKLNVLADAGDFAGITKKINGGLNGQAEREEYYHRALALFSPK